MNDEIWFLLKHFEFNGQGLSLSYDNEKIVVRLLPQHLQIIRAYAGGGECSTYSYNDAAILLLKCIARKVQNEIH